MKKCVPWRRLKRPRKRRESCKNCKIRMTIRCYLSSEKSNNAKLASKPRRKPWLSESRRRNNRCSSATKTLGTRSWQPSRKSAGRKTRLSTICTVCERRTIIRLSSASSRSERPNLSACRSRTISSSRRGPTRDTMSTWKRRSWPIK